MVGAVASQTGSQLLHIVQQIKRLLSGDIIEVSGKRVTVKDHPLARDYCVNLLARKIVVRYMYMYTCIMINNIRNKLLLWM